MKSKIKIFHVIPSLNVGGREKILRELIRKRDKDKFDIGVCCLKKKGALSEQLEKDGVRVINFEKKDGIDVSLYFKLGFFFRKEKADIIHSHSPGTLTYSMAGASIARVPVVINTEHGFAYPVRGVKCVIENMLRNLVDVNITVSNALNKQLSHWVVLKNKIITIANGIEPLDYKKKVHLSHNIKHKLGISEDEVVIGNVARLVAVKNHRLLLDTLRILLNSTSKIRLLLVGDGELRQELENYATSIGISDKVIFYGHSNEVPELLNAMDIFVLSSLNEGISITLLEAMASGKPVVATDVGGNGEVVVDGETGFLVPSNQPEAMVKVILELLNNKDSAYIMGASGRKRIEAAFNINLMVNKTEQLYLDLYSKHMRSKCG